MRTAELLNVWKNSLKNISCIFHDLFSGEFPCVNHSMYDSTCYDANMFCFYLLGEEDLWA